MGEEKKKSLFAWHFSPFHWCPSKRQKYVSLLNCRQIFSSLEKQTVSPYHMTPSHVICPSTAFGPMWTLTYLNVSLDKVFLFFPTFGSSTLAAFTLLFPSLLMAHFKWFCWDDRPLYIFTVWIGISHFSTTGSYSITWFTWLSNLETGWSMKLLQY